MLCTKGACPRFAHPQNFIASPAVTIRQIRENLREGRYSQAEEIFGIIKELVQNAEDAKAGQLIIAWTGELPGASHPLLQGPGLVAVNDGHFRSEDGRAIRRFGLNSKAADAASIGKFGLGLKSVFHLAEVFFFTAVDEGGKVLDADVLNPWSDEVGGRRFLSKIPQAPSERAGHRHSGRNRPLSGAVWPVPLVAAQLLRLFYLSDPQTLKPVDQIFQFP